VADVITDYKETTFSVHECGGIVPDMSSSLKGNRELRFVEDVIVVKYDCWNKSWKDY